jgi:hypothetical protein
VVEHSPRRPKVGGSSPTAVPGNGRETNGDKRLSDKWEYLHKTLINGGKW